MLRLTDKSIIVTGGANGLGRIYCQHLVRHGARVLIADIDFASAELLADTLNVEANDRRALPFRVDVTSAPETTAMVRAAVDNFGGVDVLLNNAGSYPHVDFDKISYEEWRRVMAVNLDSVYLCSQAVLAPMRERGSGKIINVATNLVWSGLAGMVHYIAAKSGVVGFTRALAREVGTFGITVNAIAPGAVVPQRSISKEGQKLLNTIIDYQSVKRVLRPEDLMGIVVFLSSEESNFISGQVFTVDGGLTMH
jgi:NAD(P)-dependent dehydrogenase (short-subunit alcohol dehydrogenase family)